MNKASPIEMRKALVVVDRLKKAGVLFVPVPVLNKEDHRKLMSALEHRLDVIIEKTKQEKEKK